MNRCGFNIGWGAIRGVIIRVTVSLWLLAAMPGGAVIFHSTADPAYNTTAPTGGLADSGWQYQGIWRNSYLGTAIGSNYFITAQHLTGQVGVDVFTLNGTNHTTTAVYYDPGSDLAIWKVAEGFSSWAQLYTQTNEVGRPLVVFGRGGGRGAEVNMEGQLKGWQWTGDTRKRWGENVVSGTNYIFNQYGPLLYADFDATGGVNEAHLANGDSGGGVFIQQGSTWGLAGINYAVDGYFNTTNTGSGFNAAIFDAGGLYVGSSGNWTYIPDQANDIPSSFYASRISKRTDWIYSIILPEASTAMLVSLGMGMLLARRRRA
ncbi:MAG: trypsin-like peptidase domain-containing protein [Verrucomicrobia bacterium]|nr:trypsin-like peptidase domain-containing protein [Verrucomicrobiota bacterium]